MGSQQCRDYRWPAFDVPHTIATASAASAASALGKCLLAADRPRPFVVITTHPGTDRPSVDPAGVSDEVSGLLPAIVLQAGATAGSTASLGDPLRSVNHGAARVYPTGTQWCADPDSGLHLCPGPQQGPAVEPR